MRSFSLCLVIQVLLIFVTEFCIAKHRGENATFLLHIGPHKTGSTYIQKEVLLLDNEISKAGLCVNANEHGKSQHKLASMLLDPKGGHSYDTSHIKQCLDKGGRPFISSESFAAMATKEQFNRLKAFLGGHNVHIVVFYREPATLFYSHYTELTKMQHIPFRPFSSFVGKNFDAHRATLSFEVIQRYISVFGRDHVTVLDYYGILAAKKDILQVILCDVYNVLCDAKLMPVENVNKSPDMFPYHLFNIVKNFMFTMGCKPTKPLTMWDIEIITANYTAANRIPKVRVSLTLLRQLADNIDSTIRREYGDIMLYSNATAAQVARNKVVIYELDENAFWSSPKWVLWLKKEVARLSKMRKFFVCTPKSQSKKGGKKSDKA